MTVYHISCSSQHIPDARAVHNGSSVVREFRSTELRIFLVVVVPRTPTTLRQVMRAPAETPSAFSLFLPVHVYGLFRIHTRCDPTFMRISNIQAHNDNVCSMYIVSYDNTI